MSDKHPHPHKHPHRRKDKGHHHPHRHPHRQAPRRLRREGAHHHRAPVPPVPFATDRIKRVWRFLFGWFPDGFSLGVSNCRRIAGSSRWSEHAWADALDFARPGWPQSLLGIERWLERPRQLRRFRLTRVIGPAAPNHDNHLHIDADPDHEGTPPCAG